MCKNVLPLLAIAALLGCSCEVDAPPATSEVPIAGQGESQLATPAESAFDHVIGTDTEYYVGGPQQARPPDGVLKAGTKVRLVEQAGSYCRVQTEDGIAAYVVTGSLTPLDNGP